MRGITVIVALLLLAIAVSALQSGESIRIRYRGSFP
jgi:hypothetical protein